MLPGAAQASALIGNLALNLATQSIAVNATQIDFDYTGPVTNGFPPLATGPVDGNGDSAVMDIVGGSNGSFTPVIGSTVTVHDLNAAQEPAGVVLASPLTTFITFASRPWTVTLTEVLLGTDGAAGCQSTTVGDRCTIPSSPFNLENKAGNQVAVDFEFLGTANDGSGNLSNVAGNFGTSFSNTTIKGIVDAITAGGTVVTSGHATLGFTASAVPEPGSTSLFVIGVSLLGVSLARRRREIRS
jgi:hypothetical protein